MMAHLYTGIIVLLAVVPVSTGTKLFSSRSCRYDTLHLESCKIPYFINVKHAYYGRSQCTGQGQCCPQSMDDKKKNPSDNARMLEIIKTMCNGKHECQVEGLGDLPGVQADVDYIVVHYGCKKDDDERIYSVTQCVGGNFSFIMCSLPSVIRSATGFRGNSQCNDECCPSSSDCKVLTDLNNDCDGDNACPGNPVQKSKLGNTCNDEFADYYEIKYICAEDNFECNAINMTRNEAVFDCNRSMTVFKPISITLSVITNGIRQHPARNAEVNTWFGNWTEGEITQYYRFILRNLSTGVHQFSFHLSPKPLHELYFGFDVVRAPEYSPQGGMVVQLGQKAEIPCAIRSENALALYELKWSKLPRTGQLIYQKGPERRHRMISGRGVEKDFYGMDIRVHNVSLDYAGRYMCEVNKNGAGFYKKYEVDVIVTDSTRCSGPGNAYLGTIVDMNCNVTFSGDSHVSVLSIADADGHELRNVHPWYEQKNYGSRGCCEEEVIQLTHGLNISLWELSPGHHQYYCKASFPGFIYQDDGCPINILIEPPILNISMWMEYSGSHEGDELAASCLVESDDVIRNLNIVWKLNGEQLSHGRRIEFQSFQQFNYSNEVLIKNLQGSDSGTIECVVNIGQHQDIASNTRDFFVLARPSVEISPHSLVLSKGEELIITCTSQVEKTGHPDDTQPADIVWYKDDTQIQPVEGNESFLAGYTGDIVRVISKNVHQLSSKSVTKAVIYSCQANNNAGPSMRRSCHVIVITDDNETCPSDFVDGILWPRTAGGTIMSMPCFNRAKGVISRNCSSDGTWDQTILNSCVDEGFNEVLDKISEIEDGIGVTVNKTEKIAKTLIEATGGESGPVSHPIKPGNLNASVEAIERLSMIHAGLKEPPSHSEIECIVEISSTLIDQKSKPSWDIVLQENPKLGAVIMSTLESYSEAFDKVQTGTKQRQHASFYTSNIAMQTDIVNSESGSVQYPKRTGGESWIEETLDYVKIDRDTLSQVVAETGGDHARISATYYKTLSDILPDDITWDPSPDGESQQIGSRVLSLSISNIRDGMKMKNPIAVYLQNNIPSWAEAYNAHCSYWDFSVWNGSGAWSRDGCRVRDYDHSGTLCECDHLTNFAVLVSIHRPSGILHQVLSILTMVGCSLSIICMVLTTVAYAILWKQLKCVLRGSSSRSATVVSLCLVLTSGNILFLSGIEALSPRGLCIAIGALLHYIFLVAFGIMLASSIRIFLNISSLAYGMSPDSRKTMLRYVLSALVVPALIVGVTIAIVSPEHYVSKTVCWFSVEQGVIYSFIGPIAIVVLVNSGITAVVMRKNIKSRTQSVRGNVRTLSKLEVAKSTLKGIAMLTPIMGTTWITGLFAYNERTVAFQFIFVILNSSQGIFIFLFYCLLDGPMKKAKTMWVKDRKHHHKDGIRPLKIHGSSEETGYVKTQESEMIDTTTVKK